MLQTLAFILLLAASGFAVATYGNYHWKRGTRNLRSALNAARIPVTPQFVDFHELEGLPAPVQRYFRIALTDGMPMVARVDVRHRGGMNMSATSTQWKPFTSDQQIVTRRPGFDWNARINMLPGVAVLVHDAYVAGEGSLRAALLGLVTVADMRGTADLAKGELMRFFAEAAWYPTALLPSQGVSWEAVDAHSARATLVDGAVTVTLHFGFDETGVIETVRADARGRTVGGRTVPTPWHGRFWNYQDKGGMRVPINGEVAWILPDGAQPYWRGEVTAIAHEFAK
ncbi:MULTISPECIES: DUF6920 family protein [unclassified Janthinobacterium]|uniref:DUF6920 family protein n=1 Tax=unclassified Janthinobacterium TaxID=2610881 RepID=UPI00036502A0|nr:MULTISPECIES: DUF6544 family protein [unclassified Janthinobacterium]MEC5160443.1 hypothetical protein [Janthinobacterium sp. CG_S6]